MHDDLSPPVQVEGAALQADLFAMDKDQFAVQLPVLFDYRNELPFPVNPAILFEVGCMSIRTLNSVMFPSRPVAGRGLFCQRVPLSMPCARRLDSNSLDSKLDSNAVF